MISPRLACLSAPNNLLVSLWRQTSICGGCSGTPARLAEETGPDEVVCLFLAVAGLATLNPPFLLCCPDARGVVASIPRKTTPAEYTKFIVESAISPYET